MADGARYTKLAKTAQNFVLATSPKSPGTNQTDPERFLACLAPGFRISWGHKHFVSTKPPMQGALDGEGFCQHQAGMATNLQTWRIEPTSTCVDVDKQTAVVRADFFMTAPQQEAVLNDILFWIEMDAGGEKVKSAIEFIDPVATAELMERMQAGKASPRLCTYRQFSLTTWYDDSSLLTFRERTGHFSIRWWIFFIAGILLLTDGHRPRSCECAMCPCSTLRATLERLGTPQHAVAVA